MEYSSVEQILGDLKSNKTLPIYILHGVEPYYIDLVTSYVEHEILSEAETAFNQSILYGRDVDMKQILDHARQFPMMSDKRVVIVKEAQGLRDLKSLDSYLNNPSPQTILVIAHKKKIDGRIKWVKSAKKMPEVGMFNSVPVPEYKMNNWINSYAKGEGLKITPEAVQMLTQYLGTDLKKVTNEIEKVKVNLGKVTTIDVPEIEKYIGISRDFDVYALLKAMSNGDIDRVHQITYNIEENAKSQPLQMIIPGMAEYFEK